MAHRLPYRRVIHEPYMGQLTIVAYGSQMNQGWVIQGPQIVLEKIRKISGAGNASEERYFGT